MAVIKFLKKHTALYVIVIFSLIAAVLWVYVGFIGNIATSFDIANKQYETVRAINDAIAAIGNKVPIYYHLAGAMINPSQWYVFVLIIVACLALFALTIFFTRYFFFKTAMSSIENTVKANAKKGQLKKTSVFISLFPFSFFTEIEEYKVRVV